MAPLNIANVAALNVPVICIDTCSLLDIMRDPTRDDAHVHNRKAAVDLISLIEAGDIVCLIAEQVQFEFNVHDAPIQQQATDAIRALRERVERANANHAIFYPSVAIDMAHLAAQVAPARATIERWLNASHLVPGTNDIIARAMNRVNLNISPARQGKDSIKDCLVLEQYLGAITDLRGAGMPSKAIFLSSNTKEYLSESKVLKADLSEDFDSRDMVYATNMSFAKNSLGY